MPLPIIFSSGCTWQGLLASQDALEVMFVTDLLTFSTDFTDVTLVSDDTY